MLLMDNIEIFLPSKHLFIMMYQENETNIFLHFFEIFP